MTNAKPVRTTLAEESAAVKQHEHTLRSQFAEVNWFLVRWLFLVGLHLSVQVDTPDGVKCQEHKLTYRDFTGLNPELDDAAVCDIVRQMTVILIGDVSQTVEVTHAGSQAVFTLLRTPKQV